MANLHEADGSPHGTPENRFDQAFRALLCTFSRSLPRTPLSSALRTLCSTRGHFLQRGLLRQHFFFGVSLVSLLAT